MVQGIGFKERIMLVEIQKSKLPKVMPFVDGPSPSCDPLDRHLGYLPCCDINSRLCQTKRTADLSNV